MTAYRVSPLARADMDEIWDYIAKDNPPSATRLLDKFFQKFVFLSEHPNAGQHRPEIRPNLRSFSVGNYVIYFRRSDDEIEIVRVLHGSRDVSKLF